MEPQYLKSKKSALFILLILGLFSTNQVNAGWLDWLSGNSDKIKSAISTGEPSKIATTALSNGQIVKGLKQALAKGTDYAVASLGKTGGFMNNKAVHIPMPQSLQKVETILRKVGQDKYADQFVATMNSAAEAAVPLTKDIIKDGIKKMSVKDAKAILSGQEDAATQYLRRAESHRLQQKIAPIIQQATAKAGVTSAYKTMYSKMGFAGQFLNLKDYNIDNYITQKTMDGLFTMIAQEEKKIRDNPVERTTDLLKKVFSSATASK